MRFLWQLKNDGYYFRWATPSVVTFKFPDGVNANRTSDRTGRSMKPIWKSVSSAPDRVAQSDNTDERPAVSSRAKTARRSHGGKHLKKAGQEVSTLKLTALRERFVGKICDNKANSSPELSESGSDSDVEDKVTITKSLKSPEKVFSNGESDDMRVMTSPPKRQKMMPSASKKLHTLAQKYHEQELHSSKWESALHSLDGELQKSEISGRPWPSSILVPRPRIVV